METTVYQIDLKDGRIFRIFCANSTQKRKLLASYYKIKSKVKRLREVTNGIHTIKQWEQIVKTEK